MQAVNTPRCHEIDLALRMASVNLHQLSGGRQMS